MRRRCKNAAIKICIEVLYDERRGQNCPRRRFGKNEKYNYLPRGHHPAFFAADSYNERGEHYSIDLCRYYNSIRAFKQAVFTKNPKLYKSHNLSAYCIQLYLFCITIHFGNDIRYNYFGVKTRAARKGRVSRRLRQ